RSPSPPSPKRQASSASVSPSKRRQLDTESPGLATPQPQLPESSQLEHLAQEDPPPRITTVTNNNRRAERARAKKVEAARSKKRHDLGLMKPPEKAPRKEHGAYASISQQDEPTIAWILKQPIEEHVDFYCYASTPYLTASSMLDKARAIGNATSQASAAAFLRSWRSHGTPFVVAEEPSDGRPITSTRNRHRRSPKS